MLSPARVGGPVRDRRKSRVRGAHFGDFLRHRVPTRGWSSGEKGRHVTGLWSRGHGYSHPYPRYLVSDIPFRWERRLVHRDKEGAWRGQWHPQPRLLGTPVPPREPQRAPSVGDVHSVLISSHRPTGLGTESPGHPFHLPCREAEELGGDTAC